MAKTYRNVPVNVAFTLKWARWSVNVDAGRIYHSLSYLEVLAGRFSDPGGRIVAWTGAPQCMWWAGVTGGVWSLFVQCSPVDSVQLGTVFCIPQGFLAANIAHKWIQRSHWHKFTLWKQATQKSLFLHSVIYSISKALFGFLKYCWQW